MTIEEARLRFPPGTLFDNTNIIPTAKNLPLISSNYYKIEDNGNILVGTVDKNNRNQGTYTIYNAKMDMWANIIHTKGESAPVNNYSIY